MGDIIGGTESLLTPTLQDRGWGTTMGDIMGGIETLLTPILLDSGWTGNHEQYYRNTDSSDGGLHMSTGTPTHPKKNTARL